MKEHRSGAIRVCQDFEEKRKMKRNEIKASSVFILRASPDYRRIIGKISVSLHGGVRLIIWPQFS